MSHRKKCIGPIILLWIFTVGLMLLRCFFSAELTDEAFYVSQAYCAFASPGRFVLPTAGFAFVLSPLLKLYAALRGCTDGSVLFSRLAFVACKLLVLRLYALVLRHRIDFLPRECFCLCLFAFFPLSIINFSYNTLGMLLFPLGALLLREAFDAAPSRGFSLALGAGLVYGLSAFFHNALLAIALAMLVPLVCFSSGKPRRALLAGYLSGGACSVLLCVLPMVVKCRGLTPIFVWLRFYFTHLPAGEAPTIGEFPAEFYRIILNASPLLAALTLVSLALAVAALFGFYRKDTARAQRLTRFALVFAALSVALSLNSSVSYYLAKIMVIGTLVSLFLLLVPQGDGLRGSLLRVLLLWLPGVLFLLVSLLTASGATNRRLYDLFAAAFSFLLLPDAVFETALGLPLRQRWALLRGALAALLCAVMLTGSFLFVYRDVPLTQMDATVQSGIYRGLRTSSARAGRYEALEQTLRSLLSEGETVLFPDNVPYAYLMSPGIPCTPQTWDISQYAYGWRDDALYQQYFSMIGQYPDKVVYITGEDALISGRDDPDNTLTIFVRENYTRCDSAEVCSLQVTVYARTVN